MPSFLLLQGGRKKRSLISPQYRISEPLVSGQMEPLERFDPIYGSPNTLLAHPAHLGFGWSEPLRRRPRKPKTGLGMIGWAVHNSRSEEHTSELQSPMYLVCRL